MLNDSSGKPQVCERQFFFNAQQVKSRGAGSVCTKSMVGNLAAERLLLQVVEARGALDIGQCFFRRYLQSIVYLAADQRPFKLAHKLFQMVLDHTVQVHQLIVDVIDNLNAAGFLEKIQRRRAAERLHVAGVFRE